MTQLTKRRCASSFVRGCERHGVSDKDSYNKGVSLSVRFIIVILSSLPAMAYVLLACLPFLEFMVRNKLWRTAACWGRGVSEQDGALFSRACRKSFTTQLLGSR